MPCIYFPRDPPGTEIKDLSFPKIWATDELAKEGWAGGADKEGKLILLSAKPNPGSSSKYRNATIVAAGKQSSWQLHNYYAECSNS